MRTTPNDYFSFFSKIYSDFYWYMVTEQEVEFGWGNNSSTTNWVTELIKKFTFMSMTYKREEEVFKKKNMYNIRGDCLTSLF